ncbi:2'-5' RNA ligase family protein [Ornithinimicrobium faecis]|uniref:2'-5' RNA ligase family protein n=1 Tax=Ornithinimicrobium faecis TaxID=2934158 RepID=A0ABY4YWG3_9MICO|nr:2'-5' RNA ligase family protein [Ornithinimicrobium sp. HY1793]USQ80991.1 2'-5' RNA ligase family protein [Ornithinimicrobium sp. HY1793]
MPATSQPEDVIDGPVDPGHTVLAIPVPELDAFVRERTAHYDADYLAADPTFGQAHVTVLGPWVRSPTPADLAAVAQIASVARPFAYRLARLGTFPNGIIHLLPEPAGPFRALTGAVVERFPSHPAYGGLFPDVTPHVTLDAAGAGLDEQAVEEMLGDLIPVSCRAELLQLQWWQAGHCHVQASWHLGETSGGMA